MLDADDAGVVSQSPEQLIKMMGVIVVVCAAFGLTVSEANTELFPSGWCFFYLVITGWIFDIISLCENSINQSINQSISSLLLFWCPYMVINVCVCVCLLNCT